MCFPESTGELDARGGSRKVSCRSSDLDHLEKSAIGLTDTRIHRLAHSRRIFGASAPICSENELRNVCRDAREMGSAVECGCDRKDKATGTRSQCDGPPHRRLARLVAVGTLHGVDDPEPFASGIELVSP